MKEVWEFFKINFKWLLIVAFAIFLWLQGCFKQFTPQQPTVVHDTTVIIHHYESAPYTPPVVNVLPPKPAVINLPQYQADTSSIQALRKQFDALVQKHTSQKVYNDTLRVDTLGYVNVKDTISENALVKRSYNYNIKERLIRTTITEPYKPRTQVFFGGGVTIPTTAPAIQQVELGVLIKNKKDLILGVAGNYHFKQQELGGKVSLYKLLKL